MTGVRCIVLTLALLCTGAGLPAAQEAEPCSYDACALRVRHRLFGAQLVQGHQEERVASMGLFAPALSLFGERSDSAARYYALFRQRQRSGAGLSLVGLAASLVALAVHDSNDDLATGLGIGGGVLLLGGAVQLGRAREPLSRAVWWYNRTLTAEE